jgi:predicted RNase H-like nuclease (RuvC/YqgF family)
MMPHVLRESTATVRTQIEDLQAEMEAGARGARRIHTEARIIDDRVMDHIRHTARLASLVERATEMKKSIEEQQVILRDLRTAFDRLRQSMRKHPGTR